MMTAWARRSALSATGWRNLLTGGILEATHADRRPRRRRARGDQLDESAADEARAAPRRP